MPGTMLTVEVSKFIENKKREKSKNRSNVVKLLHMHKGPFQYDVISISTILLPPPTHVIMSSLNWEFHTT